MLKYFKSGLKHEGLRKYFNNTSWLLSEQIVRLFGNVITGVLIARCLGPSFFGLFSFIIAFNSLFAGIAKLGLDEIAVRELIRGARPVEYLLGTMFRLKLAGALFVVFCSFFAVMLIESDWSTKGLIIFLSLGYIFQSYEVIDFFFQARVKSHLSAKAKLMQDVFSISLKLPLALFKADIKWFVFVTLLEYVVLAISYLVIFKNELPFLRFYEKKLGKTLFKTSLPLIVSSIMVVLYMRIDQIMLKEMLGNVEVGIYSAAARISEAWYFIPMLISSSLFPAILNAKKVDYNLYLLRLQSLYSLLIWISIAAALFIQIFGDSLMQMAFGSEYARSSSVMAIHIWSGVFVSFGVARSKWMIAEDYQNLTPYYLIIGLVINIVLNYLLIPKYGAIGASVATLLTQATVAVGAPLLFSKTRITCVMFLKSFITNPFKILNV